jgi:type IV pilus assembly protein PilY1
MKNPTIRYLRNGHKGAHNALVTGLRTVLLIGFSHGLYAAPGTLAKSPLFLASNVQPNILFLVDDSGSMDWEILLSNAARTVHPSAGDGGYLNFTPASSSQERELCYAYNVLAYNPNRVYTPWQGVDASGNAYTDMTLTAARNDPRSSFGTTNLSNQFYFPWKDDGDGVYENGECPSPSRGGDGIFDSTECAATSSCVRVSSLSAAQQTNYANWYSYYRKREYVAKRALSQIIKQSSARMGLATLHDTNNVLTPVANVDDISTPLDPAAQANKNNLLSNLFRIGTSGGTPLRQTLAAAGEYYEGNSVWGASPILPAGQGGECQQNFTILMSDGFWNGGDPAVGNADSDNNTAYDGGLYADGAANVSNTLADVAMYYYERDLNTNLPNNVRIIQGVDNNTAQHMVTYTVAFGLTGSLSASAKPGDAGFSWPTPTADTLSTIDDMRHAAFNGRGQFLSAADPQGLIDSLDAAISDIADRVGTAAAVSFNSSSLQTDTKLLKASFNSDRWSGDVTAFDLIQNPVTKSLSLGPIAWEASTDLDARTASSRRIVTFDGSSGVEFSWSSLTTAQQNDLRTDSSGTLENEAAGLARLGYIRGEHGCEESSGLTCSYTDSGGNTYSSNTLRSRTSRLGDIVHSSPIYVGPPSTRYPDNIESTPYRDFVSAYATRTGMTYVGSNDGMLHAFNDTGVELFAYIPSMLFSTGNGEGLHHLTEAGYQHRYFVDLSATVTDAFVDTGSGTADWHSVLVGALRGGGKGVFAIDVTDPASFTSASNVAGKVLWEFTHNDLGYTFSDIKVGKMNNGKWAAIFGNGYNNDPTGDGTSKIFIVYLDGSNVSTPVVLETGEGTIANGSCTDPGSDCNGMSTPATVDLNGDGTVDRIYAGDLHGKLWAFDVSSATASYWASAYGTSPAYTPLFTACSGTPCTASNRQPITSKPAVARHPYIRGVTTLPNLMVFFGTGQFLTTTDSISTDSQSFYGVWDSGVGNLAPDSLVQQTITDTTTNGIEVRTISDNAVDYAVKKGWKIPLPTSKERMVTNPVGFGHLVFFNTMIPSSTTCAAGGSGWLMAVDMVNGGTPSFQPIDVNGDGAFDSNDMVGATVSVGTRSSGIPTESRFISDKRVTANSDGSVVFENVQPSGPQSPYRMSWTGLER